MKNEINLYEPMGHQRNSHGNQDDCVSGKPETAPGVSPGLPVGGDYPANEIDSLIARCPTRVFSDSDGQIVVDDSPLHSLLPLRSRH